jgi:hypothetical protein
MAPCIWGERAMNTVFDLWYVRGYSDREDTELHIGIYSSMEAAETAVAELQTKPGFCEWPDGFEIHEVALDHANWQNGFKSVLGPKPTIREIEAYDLPYWSEKAG